MGYRDQMVTCQRCGQSFIFRIEEQKRQEALGFEIQPPRYCPLCREEMAAEPGLRPGVIKWYREDKRFGFVIQSDGREIFFHRSGVDPDALPYLREGTPVWFEVTETARGLQAINIHLRE